MPVMNSVELIGYTAEHYPEMMVLALSSYDDFSYVRGSMKSGAYDYLLKHQLTEESLNDVSQEAKRRFGTGDSSSGPPENSCFVNCFATANTFPK